MVVGVLNKRFSTQKLYGPVIKYSIGKGEIVVKVFLDSNKKRLTVFSPQHPEGEIFSDLPKDGIFYPAVQNKTQKASAKSSLKVFFKFEQGIPRDKSELSGNLHFSSDDDCGDDTKSIGGGNGGGGRDEVSRSPLKANPIQSNN